MQDLVGIVRQRGRDAARRSSGSSALNGARRARRRGGPPRVQHRLAHGAWTSPTCSIVSEAITRSAIERKESRGGHFREDYPDKDTAFATFNIVVRGRRRTARMRGVARADSAECRPRDCKQIVEENA